MKRRGFIGMLAAVIGVAPLAIGKEPYLTEPEIDEALIELGAHKGGAIENTAMVPGDLYIDLGDHEIISLNNLELLRDKLPGAYKLCGRNLFQPESLDKIKIRYQLT